MHIFEESHFLLKYHRICGLLETREHFRKGHRVAGFISGNSFFLREDRDKKRKS